MFLQVKHLKHKHNAIKLLENLELHYLHNDNGNDSNSYHTLMFMFQISQYNYVYALHLIFNVVF